ncbi:hydrolase [Lacticaseibacillus zhaodongensis]|uniref:hydrolase n=1 Tax=Lacticaseibacillus zhaodongensis TaxID=2668065 RepID=UPI003530EE0F
MSNNLTVNAKDVAKSSTNQVQAAEEVNKDAAPLEQTAKKHHIKLHKLVLASGNTLEKKQTVKITPGTNEYNQAQHQLDAEAKAKAEAAAKAEADAAAKAKAAAAAKAKAAAAAKASTTTSSSTTTSGKSYGTFKLTFYDPAVLGSNMGYSGVAANLSVFPKGTHLKITLSDGTVWYRVVNDTGTFAASNSQQLDVAMPNSQVPSAGVLSATVEVV